MWPLKLLLTPVLIVVATLAGRRWGEAAGGWLAGLPLTSGPVALFLAFEHGTSFAAASSFGSLDGAAAEAWFGIAYAWTARRCPWGLALVAGRAAFALCGALLQSLRVPLWALLLVSYAILGISLRLMPPGQTLREPTLAPSWDLPARAAVATALVIGVTAAAPFLGPRASGLLAAFPIFGTVLAVFAQRAYGAAAASDVLRGLILGLFSFCAFFYVLGITLETLGIAASFGLAILVMLVIQSLSLLGVRPQRATR